MSRKELAKPHGFTLIELLVVIAVVGLLSSIVLVNFQGTRGKGHLASGLQFSQHLHNSIGADAVGVWSFDEGTGTTAQDGSGYGNDGSINGAVYDCADTPFHEVGQGAGKCSLNFDGVNDWVNYGNIFNETPGIKYTMTVAAWFKADTTAGDRSVVSKRQFGIDNRMFDLTVGGGVVRFRIADDGNTEYSITTPFTDTANWHHAVATWDNGSQNLYLDGILESSTTRGFTKLNDSTGAFIVGAWDSGVSGYFDGKIDDVRIYSRALTTAEVREYYARTDGPASLSRLAE